MPIALIAVVVIAVLGVGGFFLTRGEDATQPVETEVVSLPSDDMTGEPKEEVDDNMKSTNPETENSATVSEEIPETTYTDGTYTSVTSYLTPKNVEHEITVEITLSDDAVSGATVLYDGAEAETGSHKRFEDAYEAEILGVVLDDVELSRTGGASLTTEAFNEAIEVIKQEAKA